MKTFAKPPTPVATRQLLLPILAMLLVSTTFGTSRALEIIPSLGFTQGTDPSAESGQFNGGVALRAPITPFLSAEGGISYREDSYSNGDLKVRMWPVTTSLWLTPLRELYVGGGLGWYRSTYDYNSSLPLQDVTTDQIGIHLGGGLLVPFSPQLGLDLNGRYIFMQKDNSIQFPTEFNPDFWTTSLGLTIKF